MKYLYHDVDKSLRVQLFNNHKYEPNSKPQMIYSDTGMDGYDELTKIIRICNEALDIGFTHLNSSHDDYAFCRKETEDEFNTRMIKEKEEYNAYVKEINAARKALDEMYNAKHKLT